MHAGTVNFPLPNMSCCNICILLWKCQGSEITQSWRMFAPNCLHGNAVANDLHLQQCLTHALLTIMCLCVWWDAASGSAYSTAGANTALTLSDTFKRTGNGILPNPFKVDISVTLSETHTIGSNNMECSNTVEATATFNSKCCMGGTSFAYGDSSTSGFSNAHCFIDDSLLSHCINTRCVLDGSMRQHQWVVDSPAYPWISMFHTYGGRMAHSVV